MVDLLAPGLERDKALVNEESDDVESIGQASLLDVGLNRDRQLRGIVTPEQRQQERDIEEKKAKLPKTWFGEAANAFVRSSDQLDQMGASLATLGADAAGMDSVRDYFVKVAERQDKEIAENPETVEDVSKITSGDKLMRYGFSALGEAAFDVIEMGVTATVGGLIGSGAAPGPGTIVGAVGGVIERQAIKNLIKGGVAEIAERGAQKIAKDELLDYGRGKLTKEALSDISKAALAKEAKRIGSKIGAMSAIGASGIGQEVGSIYDDLRGDPNISEGDRKISALLGGLAAAGPEIILENYIVGKFFKGAKAVTREQVEEAKNYLGRYIKEFGKETLKVIPAEFGTEYFQTFVEEAAKNWADPSKRDAIFEMTPEQKLAMLDSGVRAGIGGSVTAPVAAAGNMLQHPNPKVRAIESKVQGMADDLQPPAEPEEIKPDDVDQKLSQLSIRKNEIAQVLTNRGLTDEQRSELATESNQIEKEWDEIEGLDEEENIPQEGSLVNETAETPLEEAIQTPRVPVRQPQQASTPLQQAEGHLRAFSAQQMPQRKVYERTIPNLPERVEGKRKELDTLVNEATKDSKNPEAAVKFAQAVRAPFTDDVLNFLAAEDISIRRINEADKKRLDGDTSAAVFSNPDGKIQLVLPGVDAFTDTGENLVPAKGSKQARVRYASDAGTIINHELIHAFHSVSLRDQWKADKSKEDFDQYEAKIVKGLGRQLRLAHKGLSGAAYRAYNFAENGTLSDQAVGDEVLRMAIELSRTGRTTEITTALAVAEQEAEGNTKGAISKFLKSWIAAIRRIHEALEQFLGPDSPEEFKKAFEDTSRTLDKYGVLVNEKDAAIEPKEPQPTNKQKRKAKEPKKKKEKVSESEFPSLPIIEQEGEADSLTEEQKAEIQQAQADYEGRKRLARQFEKSDPQQMEKMLKGAGMQRAAEIRQITGKLTAKEQQAKDKREAGNYVGKAVSVDGRNATIKGNSFGKVTVAFDDGTTATVESERIGQALSEKEEARKPAKAAAKGPTKLVGPALAEDGKILKQGIIGDIHAKLHMAAAMEDIDTSTAEHVFADEDGNILTREEAYPIAEELGQLNEYGQKKRKLAEAKGKKPQLDSQDLIPDAREPAKAAAKGGIATDTEAIAAILGSQENSGLSKTQRKNLDREARSVSRDFDRMFLAISPKESEEKEVRGKVEWEGHTAATLRYIVRPHSQSTVEAQNIVNENGGVIVVAEELLRDSQGKKFKITEDANGDHGPNSKLVAVYENVEEQLGAILDKIEYDQKVTLPAKSFIRDMMFQLEEQRRRGINAWSSAAAYSGQSVKLLTGRQTKRDYVNVLVDMAEKVTRNAQGKFKDLANSLNLAWTKYGGVVTNQPEIIALLRKIHKLVTSSKFEKGFRDTAIQSIETLKRITKRAAARAAGFVADDENSPDYANAVARQVIGEMTGLLRDIEKKTEEQIFYGAVRRTAMSVGRQMGLIPEGSKAEKVSSEEQFVIILQNEGLYQKFVDRFIFDYNKEYGGQEPNPEFQEEITELEQRMRVRAWEQDMIHSLVNEKMKQFNLKFSEIVRKHYSKGTYEIDKLKKDISDVMKDSGVDNDALVDQLLQDVENEMLDQMEAAREKFFGSTKTIKDFLREKQITLAQAASDMSIHADNMEGTFEEILKKDYGIPNSKELPIARQLAQAMQKSLNGMAEGENIRTIDRWLRSSLKEKVEKSPESKVNKAIEKILKASKLGIMRQEDVYKALQDYLELPPYNEETANRIEQIGDQIYNSTNDRQIDEWKQELGKLMLSTKGLSTSESYVAWMYFSMLSGISTSLVNIGGNVTSLMGQVAVNAVKHPTRIPKLLGAIVRTAIGPAQLEARESFWTGIVLGKEGQKYFRGANPAELSDPSFHSFISDKFPRMQEIDKDAARFVHKAIRGVKGQYVGRALAATDMFFYKIAQEAAYTIRMNGQGGGTPQMWESSLQKAREDMLATGQNPDENADKRRHHRVLANSIYEKLRVHDSNGKLVNERAAAWDESNTEALVATFTQEPKYFLGFLAKHIENVTEKYKIGKMIVPFTRVAANVTNHMLEWTPWGFARYAFVRFGQDENPFKRWSEGKWNKDADIAIRATLGMASIFALLAKAAAEADEEDPDFAIYGGGPRDYETRRQMMERGWKPNSIKIGDTYFSYLYTPLAMAMSIVGRQMDEYRDGKIKDATDISLASTAVALLDAITNQSFLVGVTDLLRATSGQDPTKRVLAIFARMTTIPIPNLVKQLDKTMDPTIQQASGFWETWLKELPIARHTLKPAINVFGEDIERTYGLVRFPGLDRFMTMEKTDDPVFNMLGERRLKVPGFSKSTRLLGNNMDEEQYYDYVKLAGPRIKQRVSVEIYQLKKMDHEQAQDRIEQISTEEKQRARPEIIRQYKIQPKIR